MEITIFIIVIIIIIIILFYKYGFYCVDAITLQYDSCLLFFMASFL